MQKLYIDLCVYNRPFDFQGHDRIALESNAFIYLLEKIEKGDYSLLYRTHFILKIIKIPMSKKRGMYFRILS